MFLQDVAHAHLGAHRVQGKQGMVHVERMPNMEGGTRQTRGCLGDGVAELRRYVVVDLDSVE
jgi:hypothetical protein